MENYRKTNTTVSLLNYHFIFCPRYRRKIFLDNNVEKRFKEITKEVCTDLSIEIIAMEFPHLKHLVSLWTRSFFVSTAGNVSSETIKQYVENQKKRG